MFLEVSCCLRISTFKMVGEKRMVLLSKATYLDSAVIKSFFIKVGSTWMGFIYIFLVIPFIYTM